MPIRKLRKFFNNKATIFRRETSDDNKGGKKKVWVKKAWDVPCRIYAPTKRMVRLMGLMPEGEDIRVTSGMACEPGLDIRTDDKVVDDISGHSYSVVRVSHVQEKRRIHHLEVALKNVEEELE